MSIEIVELDGVDWSYVPFTLYLGRPPSEQEQDELRRLVDEWYAQGSQGAFGGPTHSLDEVGFNLDEAGVWTAEWIVDMGDASEDAVAELARRLDELASRRQLGLGNLVLGTIIIE